MPFITPPIPRNERYYENGHDFLETGWWDYLSTAAVDALYRSPIWSLKRMDELAKAGTPEGARLLWEVDMEPEPPDVSKFLSREEWEESPHYRKGLSFPDGVKEPVAKILAERYDERAHREDVLSRGPTSWLAYPARFGVALAASLLDPLNVAAAFVPVVSQARFAGLLARAGKSLEAARFAKGAIEGAAGAALVEPVVYGAARMEQEDYTMADTLANIAFGTVFGGGLHVAAGLGGDALRSFRLGGQWDMTRRLERVEPHAREAILRTAVGQLADGRAIDVEPLLLLAEAKPGRLPGRAQLQYDLPDRGFVLNDKLRPRDLEKDADFRAGKKGGDVEAAGRLADRMLTPENIQALKERLGGREPVVISMPSTSGKNVHPAVLAAKLAEALGGEHIKGEDVLTSLHTEQSKTLKPSDRPFATRRFEVAEGNLRLQIGDRSVIIVDDIFTSGGSAKALVNALHDSGIRVDDYLGMVGRPALKSGLADRQRLVAALHEAGVTDVDAAALADVLTPREISDLAEYTLQEPKGDPDAARELARKLQGILDQRAAPDARSDRGGGPSQGNPGGQDPRHAGAGSRVQDQPGSAIQTEREISQSLESSLRRAEEEPLLEEGRRLSPEADRIVKEAQTKSDELAELERDIDDHLVHIEDLKNSGRLSEDRLVALNEAEQAAKEADRTASALESAASCISRKG